MKLTDNERELLKIISEAKDPEKKAIKVAFEICEDFLSGMSKEEIENKWTSSAK